MRFHVEGSPELLALVHERLGLTSDSDGSEAAAPDAPPTPKVFLSYAWEDRELASQIAHALQANGIDTWWAEWCISAGDSLRRKIDEGLGQCTHFVVLLTPASAIKPWVNQEMDAGLMLKLQSQVKFIPLRHQLPPDQLPPLLRGMLSPSIEDPEQDINQLINDIHGITQKPSLGPAPKAAIIKAVSSQEHSAAANAIAKAFVTATKVARKFDPWMNLEELVKQTGLTEEDVIDAIHELRGMVGVHREGVYYPETELFVTFDRFTMSCNPKDDALALATDMLNDDKFPTSSADIAAKYGWDARRLNPALAFLENRNLVRSRSFLGQGDWVVAAIYKTDATRRFVKSRQ
nr:toll/interleukin-1 receptor domain-containing protein [Geomonas sp. Red32]